MSPHATTARALQTGPTTGTAATPPDTHDMVRSLRAMSLRGLARMYDASTRTFVFRVRWTPHGIVQEGLSHRYTAITLLGLAGLTEQTVSPILDGHTRRDVCTRLIEGTAHSNNLGDVALTLLAAGLMDHEGADSAARQLAALHPVDGVHPVVELAWAVTALSDVKGATRERLRDRVAERLMSAFNPQSKLFPHIVGATGARAHVSCFADLIYPIQALAKYAAASGNARALEMAAQTATHLCSLQGDAGQWWWHYDYRSGQVLERYPVYAIHQDAMGPMGLLALAGAGGPDFSREIDQGLQWLAQAPELNGGSLIDRDADLIWRKVCRREPRKAVRYLQAAAARIHPSVRIPAVDLAFPAKCIDYEDRPYHLGWLLYAWNDGTSEGR